MGAVVNTGRSRDALPSVSAPTMTRMMASLADPLDAKLAAEHGVDVIEVVLPQPDVDPLPNPETLRAIRSAFPGTLRVRVPAPERQAGAIEAAVLFGADEIALPPDSIPEAANTLLGLAPLLRPVALVARLKAERELPRHPPSCGQGRPMMLDMDMEGRLIDVIGIDRLAQFAQDCEATGVPFGLAGGLEAPDVARLLPLRPDVLGFAHALRRHHRPHGAFDPEALAAIRALIPRGPQAFEKGPVAADPDVVFVRDFVALLSIGAYRAEHGRRQRVRFSVDAELNRPVQSPADMAGIFSYDIIIETIRVLAARPHVTFVENLAEDLATALLAHRQIGAVTVKVEKLDVIEGAVGVVIRRGRPLPAGP